MGWDRGSAFGMDVSGFIGWWAGTHILLERRPGSEATVVALGALGRSARTVWPMFRLWRMVAKDGRMRGIRRVALVGRDAKVCAYEHAG